MVGVVDPHDGLECALEFSCDACGVECCEDCRGPHESACPHKSLCPDCRARDICPKCADVASQLETDDFERERMHRR